MLETNTQELEENPSESLAVENALETSEDISESSEDVSLNSEIEQARFDDAKLQSLLEAIILAANRPISFDEILKLFTEEERPSKPALRSALTALQENSECRGVVLTEVASGYQYQVKLEWAPIISRLWEEKAPRYSRALFETLALIAYRQPITRGEIEEIRGVSLSPSIFKTLIEDRDWVRIVGHREVPGRPALYATTKNFLDYFGLKSLEELPSLPEVMNLDAVQLPDLSELLSKEKAEQISEQIFESSELSGESDLLEANEATEICVELENEVIEEELDAAEEVFEESIQDVIEEFEMLTDEERFEFDEEEKLSRYEEESSEFTEEEVMS